MTTMNRRPRVGDECWEVEWCDRVAVHEGTTDVDPDRCGYSFDQFPTRAEALAFAVRTWPATTDKLGIVMLRPMRYVRDLYTGFADWERAGDTEHVSDSSGETEEAHRRAAVVKATHPAA